MQLNDGLRALGDLLHADNEDVSIVVVGGMSLYLLGLVERATLDVDVIALATGSHDSEVRLNPPDPLPAPLARGIATVARDLGLPTDWMNTEVALQWQSELPPTLAADIEWRRYGGLNVGLVGRRTLIALKLFAAVDHGPQSVHYQDLVSMRPSVEELQSARQWVATQDASEAFALQLNQAMQHVLRTLTH